MDTLNLSKYTDEIANIIVNSLTEKDIEFYAEVLYCFNNCAGGDKAEQVVCQFSVDYN